MCKIDNLTQNDWQEALNQSKSRCKRWKKKSKKLKGKMKKLSCMDKSKKRKIKRKLCYYKKKLDREKDLRKRYSEELMKMEFSMMLAEKSDEWKDEKNELQKKIIRMDTSNSCERQIIKMLLTEMLPGLVKKYGYSIAKQEPFMIEQD